MITPEAMSKVRIITPKSYGYSIINKLYELRLFHVNNYTKGELEGLDNGAPLIQAEEISKTLLMVRAVKNKLQIERMAEVPIQAYSPHEFERVKQRITTMNSTLIELSKKINDQEAELKHLGEGKMIVEALDRLGMDIALLSKLRRVAYFIGTVKNDVKEKLKKAVQTFELKTSEFPPVRTLMGNSDSAQERVVLDRADFNGEQLILLLVRKEDESNARSVLSEAGFSALPVEGYAEVRLPKLDKNIVSAKKALETTKKAVRELKEKNMQFLAEQEFILEEEIKKAELPLQFATTAQSFIAQGYVPLKQLGTLKHELHKATRDHILIEESEPGNHDDVPVKLNNREAVKNFEVLTRLYELPQHIEIDPTWLMFITFPLFFAYMLGDVGYGATLLIVFLYLKKKFPSGKQFLTILTYAALVTLVFGVAFGEYFGFEHVSLETGEKLCNVGVCFNKEIIEAHGKSEVVYSFPRLLNRGHSHVNIFGYEILTVLFIGALVGAVHLNIGFLIGFYNVWRAHGLKMAVLEKLSWLVMEAGLALLVLSLTNRIIVPVWVGILVFVGALVMIYMGEGVKGLIELPALFSNMLSYMRLGAVGLASVGLAVVINENLAKPFLEKGGIYIIIALLIMILGHIINIGLGVLGPFLHSIRLHYVEFFSKFFHGGGQEYIPFGTKAQMGGE